MLQPVFLLAAIAIIGRQCSSSTVEPVTLETWPNPEGCITSEAEEIVSIPVDWKFVACTRVTRPSQLRCGQVDQDDGVANSLQGSVISCRYEEGEEDASTYPAYINLDSLHPSVNSTHEYMDIQNFPTGLRIYSSISSYDGTLRIENVSGVLEFPGHNGQFTANKIRLHVEGIRLKDFPQNTMSVKELHLNNVTLHSLNWIRLLGTNVIKVEQSNFQVLGCDDHESTEVNREIERVRLSISDSTFKSVRPCPSKGHGNIHFDEFKLRNVSIEILEANAFSNITAKEFDLTLSNIGHISTSAFNGLRVEEKFSFSQNQVRRVDGWSFQGIGSSRTNSSIDIKFVQNTFQKLAYNAFDINTEKDFHQQHPPRFEFSQNMMELSCDCEELQTFLLNAPVNTFRPPLKAFNCSREAYYRNSDDTEEQTVQITPHGVWCTKVSCKSHFNPAVKSFCEISSRETLNQEPASQLDCSSPYTQDAADTNKLLDAALTRASHCEIPQVLLTNIENLELRSGRTFKKPTVAGKPLEGLTFTNVTTLTLKKLPRRPSCCKTITFSNVGKIRLQHAGSQAADEALSGEESSKKPSTVTDEASSSSGKGINAERTAAIRHVDYDGVNELTLQWAAQSSIMYVLCCNWSTNTSTTYDGEVSSIEQLLKNCKDQCKRRQENSVSPVPCQKMINSIKNGDPNISNGGLRCSWEGPANSIPYGGLEGPSNKSDHYYTTVVINAEDKLVIENGAFSKLRTRRLELLNIPQLELKDGSLLTAGSDINGTEIIIRNSTIVGLGHVFQQSEEAVMPVNETQGEKPSLDLENVTAKVALPGSIFNDVHRVRIIDSNLTKGLSSANGIPGQNHSLNQLVIERSSINNIEQHAVELQHLKTLQIRNASLTDVSTGGIDIDEIQSVLMSHNRFHQLQPGAFKLGIVRLRLTVTNNRFVSGTPSTAIVIIPIQPDSLVQDVENNLAGNEHGFCDCKTAVDSGSSRKNRENIQNRLNFDVKCMDPSTTSNVDSLDSSRQTAGELLSASEFYTKACQGSWIKLAIIITPLTIALIIGLFLVARKIRKSKAQAVPAGHVPRLQVISSNTNMSATLGTAVTYDNVSHDVTFANPSRIFVHETGNECQWPTENNTKQSDCDESPNGMVVYGTAAGVPQPQQPLSNYGEMVAYESRDDFRQPRQSTEQASTSASYPTNGLVVYESGQNDQQYASENNREENTPSEEQTGGMLIYGGSKGSNHSSQEILADEPVYETIQDTDEEVYSDIQRQISVYSTGQEHPAPAEMTNNNETPAEGNDEDYVDMDAAARKLPQFIEIGFGAGKAVANELYEESGENPSQEEDEASQPMADHAMIALEEDVYQEPIDAIKVDD